MRSTNGPGGSAVLTNQSVRGDASSAAISPADLTSQLTLAPLSVGPYSTSDFSLDAVTGQVSPPLPYCSIRIQYSGAPGSMVAQVSSVDVSRDIVIDAPVANEGDGWRGSGANPWRLDEETESILFLTDEGDKPVRVGFSVTAGGVHYYLTKLKLAPHETRAIDLRKLRDAQQPDFKRNLIPADATDGSVNWIRLDNVAVSGRLLVFQRHTGLTATYDCCYCACPASYTECDITPAPPSCIGPNTKMQLTCIAYYTDCNSNQSLSDVTDLATWTSDNGAVFNMDSQTPGLVDGVGAGTAHATASFTDYTYTPVPPDTCDVYPWTDSYSSPVDVVNSGCPDHLEVASDTYHYLSCAIGQIPVRDITYDILDANGNYVTGATPVDEAFSPYAPTNSCGNGSPTATGCTNSQNDGSFTDELTVHCNTVGGSCGFTMTQQWHWCPSSAAEVAIGTLANDIVHADSITVLGYKVPPDTGEIPTGTKVYP